MTIQIINSNDDTSSNIRQYTYIPNEQVFRAESSERKRQRIDDEAKRFFGGPGANPFIGGAGGFPPNLGGPSQNFGMGGGGGSSGGGYMTHAVDGSQQDQGQQQLQAQAAAAPLNPEITKLCVKFFSALGDPKYILAAFQEASQQRDENGDTPLIHAIANGNTSIAIALLETASSPDVLNRQNLEGDTPLHVAVWTGNVAVIRKLLESGARVDVVDHKGRTPIHVACEADSATTLDALLVGIPGGSPAFSVRAFSGQTALHFATLTNKTDMVDSLVSHGAALNEADSVSGATPLMNAAKNANLPAIDIISKSKAWNSTLLSQVDFRGNTALHFAVATNSKETLRILLELGAGLNPSFRWRKGGGNRPHIVFLLNLRPRHLQPGWKGCCGNCREERLGGDEAVPPRPRRPEEGAAASAAASTSHDDLERPPTPVFE